MPRKDPASRQALEAEQYLKSVEGDYRANHDMTGGYTNPWEDYSDTAIVAEAKRVYWTRVAVVESLVVQCERAENRYRDYLGGLNK